MDESCSQTFGGSTETQGKLNKPWLRPRQNTGMSVNDYIDQFTDWKDMMEAQMFSSDELSYVEDFNSGLDYNICIRVRTSLLKPINLSTAYSIARIEEAMMSIESFWGTEHMKDEAHNLFDNMPTPDSAAVSEDHHDSVVSSGETIEYFDRENKDELVGEDDQNDPEPQCNYSQVVLEDEACHMFEEMRRPTSAADEVHNVSVISAEEHKNEIEREIGQPLNANSELPYESSKKLEADSVKFDQSIPNQVIEPKWVLDGVKAFNVIITEEYKLGEVLPPHLSPFVDNEAEGHVSDYETTIKQEQAAVKEVFPLTGMGTNALADPQNLMVDDFVQLFDPGGSLRIYIPQIDNFRWNLFTKIQRVALQEFKNICTSAVDLYGILGIPEMGIIIFSVQIHGTLFEACLSLDVAVMFLFDTGGNSVLELNQELKYILHKMTRVTLVRERYEDECVLLAIWNNSLAAWPNRVKMEAVPNELTVILEVSKGEVESVLKRHMCSKVEKFEFQVQVSWIMDTVVIFLYGNKDVVLGELIFDSYDALDRIVIPLFSEKEYMGGGDTAQAEIHFKLDRKQKILTELDEGIRMTNENSISSWDGIAKFEILAPLEVVQTSGDLKFSGRFGDQLCSTYLVFDYVEDAAANDESLEKAEIQRLTSLDQEDFISLLGFYFKDYLSFACHLLYWGSLENNLHDGQRSRYLLSLEKRCEFALSIAVALEHFHSILTDFVSHRGVQTPNVLFSKDFDPKLSGFGFAVMDSGSICYFEHPDFTGTCGYMLLKYFRQSEVIDQIHVYARANLWWELLHGIKRHKGVEKRGYLDKNNVETGCAPSLHQQMSLVGKLLQVNT